MEESKKPATSKPKMKSRYPNIKFDKLKMYFSYPYVIDLPSAEGIITITPPKLGDVIELGVNDFFASLYLFVANTTMYRLPLWEAGKDWNTTSDFELFITLVQGVDEKFSKLLFNDLDWSNFKAYEKSIPLSEEDIKNGKTEPDTQFVMYDAINHIEINEEVYNHISQYLRTIFNIFPEEKFTSDNTMKQWYIDKDKRKLKKELKKKKEDDNYSSSFQAMISACVNHPGFKYKLNELKEVGIAEFYDSVQRLQIYENSTALLKGIYSGFVDGKGINSEDMNFMRELNS